MTLKKYLKEGIGERTLHHYTSYFNLINILKENGLRANKYPGTPEGYSQVSFVRPSMANKKNIQDLSASSGGGVKIIFDASKASDIVRGMKVNTISEFPVSFKKTLSRSFGKHNSKNINKIIKDLDSFSDNNKGIIEKSRAVQIGTVEDRYGKKATSELIQLMKKWEIFFENSFPRDSNIILNSYRIYDKNKNKKEGEERVTLKGKNKKILPLNSKYIKIELLKPLSKASIAKDSKRKIKEEILKNKELFVDNENFRQAIK